MNRRDFLKRTGLAGLAATLGWEVAERTPEPTVVPDRSVPPQIHSISDAIFAIDPSEVLLLHSIGAVSGVTAREMLMSNPRWEWREDIMTPVGEYAK